MDRPRKPIGCAALAVAAWLVGCATVPEPVVVVSPQSSMLAVDVRYQVAWGFDPGLVQAFFVKDPTEAHGAAPPNVIPATFVKGERAYLLDPEPGTYSLVAVSSLVAPISNPTKFEGVEHTIWTGKPSYLVVLPADLAARTQTQIERGGVVFMGALHVEGGDEVETNAELPDAYQRRLADQLQSGVVTPSGGKIEFAETWQLVPQGTHWRRTASDRAAFFRAAFVDLGDSPWSQVAARGAPVETLSVREEVIAQTAPPSPEPPAFVTARAALAEPSTLLADPVAPEPVPAPDTRVAVARPSEPAPDARVAVEEPSEPATPVEAANPIEPAAPVESEPAAPVESEPVAPVESEPAAPVESQPVAPEEPQPAAPVKSQPAAPVASRPPAPIESRPPAPVESQPPAPEESPTVVAVRAQLESPHTELAARPVVDEPAVIASSPAPEPVQIAAATPPASAVPAETPAPASGRRRFKGLPPGSPLEQIEFGMRHFEVLEILGQPAEKTRRSTRKAWIPFYTGPGAHLVDWRYDAIGTVIFSLHHGRLEVVDLVAVAP